MTLEVCSACPQLTEFRAEWGLPNIASADVDDEPGCMGTSAVALKNGAISFGLFVKTELVETTCFFFFRKDMSSCTAIGQVILAGVPKARDNREAPHKDS